MSELGILERVKRIRDIWLDEARNFTPWLGEPENLSILADTLGFGPDGLEVEAIESPVGSFRADILCRDTSSPDGERVLIENQFGRSDHDHLGKILTYASGLKARTVILIGETIREEHRAALDWLNDISDDEHRFFACELELWRIGGSLPAPKFNVVVKPNDWVRSTRISIATSGGAKSELKQTYRRYWEYFSVCLSASDTKLKPRKPAPQQWMGFGIGRSGPELTAAISNSENRIRAELFLHGVNAKDWFGQLLEQKTEVEAEIGEILEWDALPNRQGARISISIFECDPTAQSDWERQHKWLVEMLNKFDQSFRSRVKLLQSIGDDN